MPDIEATLWALALAVGFFIAAAGIAIVRRRNGKNIGIVPVILFAGAAYKLFRAYGFYFQ